MIKDQAKTDELVTIFLTPQEADRFLLFQKHYDLLKLMDEKNVWDVGFGKVIFNIAFGEIQNIVREEVVYKK